MLCPLLYVMSVVFNGHHCKNRRLNAKITTQAKELGHIVLQCTWTTQITNFNGSVGKHCIIPTKMCVFLSMSSSFESESTNYPEQRRPGGQSEAAQKKYPTASELFAHTIYIHVTTNTPRILASSWNCEKPQWKYNRPTYVLEATMHNDCKASAIRWNTAGKTHYYATTEVFIIARKLGAFCAAAVPAFCTATTTSKQM